MVLAAGAIAAADRVGVKPKWLLIALLLHLVHEAFLTRFWWQFATPLDGAWNWSGKIMALAATLAIAALPAFGWRRTGLTSRQGASSGPAWLLAGAYCLYWLIVASFTDDGRAADRESAAFMWLMPGPEEEAFFRGILLLALNEAFVRRRRILGADMGWGALLTAILFGSVHGISFDDGRVGFDAGYFASTFLSGLFLVWLRESTGSLLAPILCHGVRDGAFRVI